MLGGAFMEYGFKFQYRETKGSELITDYGFCSDDKNVSNAWNACEIAMLRFIKSHNYYSAKLIKAEEINHN